MERVRLALPGDAIRDFCRRWQIAELSLFGSVLRADFRQDSDVDVLATFAAGARWSLLDMARMQTELEEILGRSVDFGERTWVEASENPVRRREILESLVPIYVAG